MTTTIRTVPLYRKVHDAIGRGGKAVIDTTMMTITITNRDRKSKFKMETSVHRISTGQIIDILLFHFQNTIHEGCNFIISLPTPADLGIENDEIVDTLTTPSILLDKEPKNE